MKVINTEKTLVIRRQNFRQIAACAHTDSSKYIYLEFSKTIYFVGLLQVVILSFLSNSAVLEAVLQLSLFSCIFFVSLPLLRLINTRGLAENFWATWSFGGLGMLLGHQLDNYGNASQTHHHHGVQSPEVVITQIMPWLFNSMTMIMLLFCIPACIFLCNRRLDRCSLKSKWVLHTGSTFCMMLGMLLASISQSWLFQGYELSTLEAHYYMLLLMVFTCAIAYYSLNKIIKINLF